MGRIARWATGARGAEALDLREGDRPFGPGPHRGSGGALDRGVGPGRDEVRVGEGLAGGREPTRAHKLEIGAPRIARGRDPSGGKQSLPRPSIEAEHRGRPVPMRALGLGGKGLAQGPGCATGDARPVGGVHPKCLGVRADGLRAPAGRRDRRRGDRGKLDAAAAVHPPLDPEAQRQLVA